MYMYNMENKKELNREEKLKLLNIFFQDDIMIKALNDTLNDKELNAMLFNNIDTILSRVVEEY